MAQRVWLITGVSSGFGRHLTEQLLARGERVVGTVRTSESVSDVSDAHPEAFRAEVLDVRDTAALRGVVARTVEDFGGIDVAISNAGYGVFGAAEELTDEQIEAILATNLTASIQFIRAVLPVMRAAGGGRIIQMSTYGGQVAFAGNSLYHASKWGIEGFCESVAHEVEPFGIGVTIVEPGGARTEFRYGSAQVADALPAYRGTPARSFEAMLKPENGLAPGDPARMATVIIDSVDQTPAPLRIVLGSQALTATIHAVEGRLADFRTQTEVAASTDYPPG
jgi:NAD(P)-dependent dehydrogenase (short-subunit alcohol dehydrogenase family)